QSGCERLRIYRRACGKSRLWEKHVRPNTHGTVEGRLQGTRKIPLAKVGIPSVFRRREDVNVHHVAIEVAPMGELNWTPTRGVPTSQDVPLPFGALSSDAGEVSIGCCATSLVL